MAGLPSVIPIALRFENTIAGKMLKQAWTFFRQLYLFVTTVGFEPTRPYEHHPLKMASLPFLHVAKKQKKSNKTCSTFCDPTGARTQDPIIKSDVLYRLSYRVFKCIEEKKM